MNRPHKKIKKNFFQSINQKILFFAQPHSSKGVISMNLHFWMQTFNLDSNKKIVEQQLRFNMMWIYYNALCRDIILTRIITRIVKQQYPSPSNIINLERTSKVIMYTLNAICSRKNPAPLFFSDSYLLPQPIQRPTCKRQTNEKHKGLS